MSLLEDALVPEVRERERKRERMRVCWMSDVSFKGTHIYKRGNLPPTNVCFLPTNAGLAYSHTHTYTDT